MFLLVFVKCYKRLPPCLRTFWSIAEEARVSSFASFASSKSNWACCTLPDAITIASASVTCSLHFADLSKFRYIKIGLSPSYRPVSEVLYDPARGRLLERPARRRRISRIRANAIPAVASDLVLLLTRVELNLSMPELL
jgi:hypothetical protein